MMRHTLRLCPGLTEQACGMAGPPAGPVLQARRKRGVGPRPGGPTGREEGALMRTNKSTISVMTHVVRFGRSECVGAPVSGI